MAKQELDFLADVERAFIDAYGFPKGSEVLLKICQQHAGKFCYVPGRTTLFIGLRNEQIRDEFNGDNYDELLAKYKKFGVSTTRHLRRIIHA